MGEQDPALAKKEDSMEYSAKTPPTTHYQSAVASPIATPTTSTLIVAPATTTFVDPTATKSLVAATAKILPLVWQNTVVELLVGVSAIVNNLHTFVAEEAQCIIDHVNTELHKLHGCLD